jgi:hypothetical protein
MPPRALTPITRTVNVSPPLRTPGVPKATITPRQALVLQSSRAPAQLSLFGRTSSAR